MHIQTNTVVQGRTVKENEIMSMLVILCDPLYPSERQDGTCNCRKHL